MEWTYKGRENAAAAKKLQEGNICLLTGYGQSMTPILKSGQSVICIPVTEEIELAKNDIVFCKVGGHYYLHKIVAIKNRNRYTIGNNHGHINGTIGRENIFGLVVRRLQRLTKRRVFFIGDGFRMGPIFYFSRKSDFEIDFVGVLTRK